MTAGWHMRGLRKEPGREELEDELLRKVRAARAAYVRACAELERITETARSGGMSPAEGTEVVRRATAARDEAFREYSHALKTFADLVVDGHLPAEIA